MPKPEPELSPPAPAEASVELELLASAVAAVEELPEETTPPACEEPTELDCDTAPELANVMPPTSPLELGAPVSEPEMLTSGVATKQARDAGLDSAARQITTTRATLTVLTTRRGAALLFFKPQPLLSDPMDTALTVRANQFERSVNASNVHIPGR